MNSPNSQEKRRIRAMRTLLFVVILCSVAVPGIRETRATQVTQARRTDVRFVKEDLNQLDQFSLFFQASGQLSGKLGQSKVEIRYDRIKSVDVSFAQDTLRVDLTTISDEVFKGIVIDKGASLSVFSPLAGGRLSLDLPYTAVSRIEFGDLRTFAGETSQPGSVLGDFTWEDGSSLSLTVWNRPKEGYSSLGGGLGIVIAGCRVSIPWPAIKSIHRRKQDSDDTAAVTLLTGVTLTGKQERDQLTVYWKGLEAVATNWTAAEFSRRDPVKRPEWISTCCDGAGGCSGGDLDGDWGTWRFVSQNSESIKGVLTGGYGGDNAVGDYPDDLTVGEYADGKLKIDLMPKSRVSRFDFQWEQDSVTVVACLKNGEVVRAELKGKTFERLSKKGYLAWSALGEQQTRLLVRVRQLARMELTDDQVPKDWKESAGDIPHEEYIWELELAGGGKMTGQHIEGYQRQPVPDPPPAGKYWLIRPPTEDGLAGGRYVVSPHTSGFLLVPLYLVQTVNPTAHEIELQEDASGRTLQYTRFHPGRRWIAEGVSGLTYVDYAADEALKHGTAELFKFSAQGMQAAIPAGQVVSIRRTAETAKEIEKSPRKRGGFTQSAVVETTDGSKHTISDVTWTLHVEGGTKTPFAHPDSACRSLLMGRTSEEYLSSFFGALAVRTENGLWTKIEIADVVRMYRRDGDFRVVLDNGAEHSVGSLSGKIQGTTSLGKTTIDFADIATIQFEKEAEPGSARQWRRPAGLRWKIIGPRSGDPRVSPET